MIDEKTLQAYNQTRTIRNIKYVCHAPFTNMYFNSMGNVGACWLTLEKAPRYPEKSLREIWFGEHFNRLRENIKSRNLEGPCEVCEKRINTGVYRSTLAQAYDLEHEFSNYPSIMEFELSNTCNLACIMCKGTLSSKIRRDREKLPPLQSPYGPKFTEELAEFIPHLKEARFNGGEPFLQSQCWAIWEKIAEINPDILITVATNATTLTEKSKQLLERCKFRVNVSLDSLKKETYEAIRIGSHFETVIENLEYLGEYCRRKGTIFSIMVNPMRNNWRELPGFVSWCNSKNYHLWFNTIWRPKHLAIWTLPTADQLEIFETLSKNQFERPDGCEGAIFQHNTRVFNDFVRFQLNGWMKDQHQREHQGADYETGIKSMRDSKTKFWSASGLYDLRSKIEIVQEKTNSVLSEDAFYFHLSKVEPDEIRRRFETGSFEQTSEWIYRVGDYY